MNINQTKRAWKFPKIFRNDIKKKTSLQRILSFKNIKIED